MNRTKHREEPCVTTTTPGEIEPKRLDDFARRLATLSERRIQSKVLWTIFAEAFPHRPRGAETRRWILAALRHAEAQGVIKIPPTHGRRWDRSFEPHIPTSVDRIEPPKSPQDKSWRLFPWHSRLQWVADLPKLAPDQELFLQRVHKGFVNREFDQLAPLKYRSLQLTSNEKRLGVLAKGALFGPGRLSLELLGCLQDIPPLPWEAINEQPSIIIFENTASFAVARGVLMEIPHSPYGMIACGGGASFIQSIRHLTRINRSISRIEYVGDLDRPGLRIAKAACEAAIRIGLPPVEPAAKMHYAMLQAVRKFGHPSGLKYRSDENSKNDEALVAWLPIEIRTIVLEIFASNCRVPEEVLGPDELRAIWFDNTTSC